MGQPTAIILLFAGIVSAVLGTERLLAWLGRSRRGRNGTNVATPRLPSPEDGC